MGEDKDLDNHLLEDLKIFLKYKKSDIRNSAAGEKNKLNKEDIEYLKSIGYLN